MPPFASFENLVFPIFSSYSASFYYEKPFWSINNRRAEPCGIFLTFMFYSDTEIILGPVHTKEI
jgi:hypothetical protein